MYFIWANTLFHFYFMTINYEPFSNIPFFPEWFLCVLQQISCHFSDRGKFAEFRKKLSNIWRKVQISDHSILQLNPSLQHLLFLLNECKWSLFDISMLSENTSAVAEHMNFKNEMSFDFNVTFVITEVYIFYTKIWFV